MKKGLAAVAIGLFALTGCTNTPPPASEVADEVIDMLDVDDSVKECMRQKLAGFRVDESTGFDNIDDVASAAADGKEDAQALMDAFEAALASCN